jgi:hypothetical protein
MIMEDQTMSLGKGMLNVSVLLLLCFTVESQAEIYRWVDEQGRQQFSDTPPLDSDYGKVAVTPVNDYAPPARGARKKSSTKSAKSRRRSNRNNDNKSNNDKVRSKCLRKAKRVNRIDQKLRAGVSYKRLQKLTARRRQLKDEIWSSCRRMQIWTSKELRRSR